MNKIIVLCVIFAASGVSSAQGEKSPVFGQIAGLVAVEKLDVRASRTTPHRQKQREWIRLFVNRGDVVRKGQKIAEHRNSKGKVVLEYIANRAGRILLKDGSTSDAVDTTLEIITVGEDKYCEYENCTQIGTR
ncbi:hypothetical protein ACJJIK_13650 [Microbulbifer sp. ZKSA006]|uniref:hypothetical protein n=1 Tax=Microbulbifer sp. ZKSA006 TaxID=3243390 RepID=UPI0040390008